MLRDRRPFNHYVCSTCHGTTVTWHVDEGVTPVMVRCRATPGCMSMALSAFYNGSQDDTQLPHLLWWRPRDRASLEAALRRLPVDERAIARDHVERGGCLMREVKCSNRIGLQAG